MTSWTSLPTEEAFITLRALGRVALTLVTNLVLDPEGDQRFLGDPQVQASDLFCADNEGSSSKSEDSSDQLLA